MKDGKRYSMKIVVQKTVEEAILLIDKIDFESETVTRGKKKNIIY